MNRAKQPQNWFISRKTLASLLWSGFQRVASIVGVRTINRMLANVLWFCYHSGMQSIDLTHVFENYQGLWVVFTDDYEVVSADKDAKKVYQTAVNKGYKTPRLFKMPKRNIPFVVRQTKSAYTTHGYIFY